MKSTSSKPVKLIYSQRYVCTSEVAFLKNNLAQLKVSTPKVSSTDRVPLPKNILALHFLVGTGGKSFNLFEGKLILFSKTEVDKTYL